MPVDVTGTVRTSVDVALTPKQAFDNLLDEIKLALMDRGMKLDSESVGGRILEGDVEVGAIKEWVADERISIIWHPKSWDKTTTSELTILISASDGGATVAIEQRDWGRVVGDDGAELLGWFAKEVASSLLSASAPNRLGDWITDRRARRPSGAQSRDFYRNPVYHWPNFLAILDTLALRPDDHLLEVGCGGGAFLSEALKSGCRASAVDHSLDMVRLASEVNRESIAKGRLRVEVGEADELPYQDGSFTCAVMTGVFNFIADPLEALKEVCRVLGKGGRLVIFSGTKELRGTPAAPEPAASRLHFYEDSEIEDLARRAGFHAVKVEHPSLLENAKKAGVPEADLGLFRGTSGSQLVVARKV